MGFVSYGVIVVYNSKWGTVAVGSLGQKTKRSSGYEEESVGEEGDGNMS